MGCSRAARVALDGAPPGPLGLISARSTEDAGSTIRASGVLHLPAEIVARQIGDPGGVAWRDFAASWTRLEPDRYMADGGTYRCRRFSVMALSRAGTTVLQDQPHYQERIFNPLNGGVERWYAPLEATTLASPILARLLEEGRGLTADLSPGSADLRAEVHQFRVEADQARAGRPTPEGLHRDGVLLALILLVGRIGVQGGVTRVTDPAGDELGAVELDQPMEALWLNDRRVLHETTPLRAAPGCREGHRDVLVATFRPLEFSSPRHSSPPGR